MKLIIQLTLLLLSFSSLSGPGGTGGNPTPELASSTLINMDNAFSDLENDFNELHLKKTEIHKILINPKKVDFILDNKGRYFHINNSFSQELPTQNLESIGLKSGQIINFK